MSGCYRVIRQGTWIDALVVEANTADEAIEISETIPEADWAATRWIVGGGEITLGGVSLSDTTPAWNEGRS
jgi:hypothetical protein